MSEKPFNEKNRFWRNVLFKFFQNKEFRKIWMLKKLTVAKVKIRYRLKHDNGYKLLI